MSSRNKLLAAVIATAALAGVALAVTTHWPKPNATAHLVFTPTYGEQPLEFDRFVFNNPAGNELFRIRDFRFFLNNIALEGAERRYEEPDSYHLVRFDQADGAYRITLPALPLRTLVAISFSIGVDAAANRSLESRGDLDPNSQMAWNWEVGYKFVLIEGGIRIDGDVRPLVYHVGFDENRRDMRFETPDGFELRDGAEIHFTVDLRKVFAGKTQIDMAQLRSVKFNRVDAKQLSDNYEGMINVDWK